MSASGSTSTTWMMALGATVAAATLLFVASPQTLGTTHLVVAVPQTTARPTVSSLALGQPFASSQKPVAYARAYETQASNPVDTEAPEAIFYTQQEAATRGIFGVAMVAVTSALIYFWRASKHTGSDMPLLQPIDVELPTAEVALAATSGRKDLTPPFYLRRPVVSNRDVRRHAEKTATEQAPTKKAPKKSPHTYEPYYDINGTRFYTDEYCNTTTRILEKLGTNLHLKKNHPLNILKRKIEEKFPGFEVFDDLTPVVTTFQNFDSLLIEEGHPARSPTDTYYLNKDTLMRPHTSAHQHDLLTAGHTQFLCAGDVYRRDEIDRTHFWCFHQCEGVKVMDTTDTKEVEADLKAYLENMVKGMFGDLKEDEIRWVDAYFPFTEPSWEMEIMWQGDWLEVLGCGIMQQQILENAGADGNGTKRAWAFGIGLERIAMPLFKIPDIRIFWSENKRFMSQFEGGEIVEFQPLVSLKDFPANNKDISMWVPDSFADNDFFDLISNFDFSNLIEEVELFDEFTHPKTGRKSKAFHVVFRSPERTLTTEEVNVHMEELRAAAVDVLNVELR
jgi:phenylalanyl-tRNA synthetase alpha chain